MERRGCLIRSVTISHPPLSWEFPPSHFDTPSEEEGPALDLDGEEGDPVRVTATKLVTILDPSLLETILSRELSTTFGEDNGDFPDDATMATSP